ncbi:MAG TPA: SpoIIE family protein phosphatase [Spirochaetota bacterium]|nr:SpoIIE family protein phosphatase [Spirochaetota bacterium]HPC40852.1 SpoIIE family protein phosphatase [Spirochaetota bacterium]HPL17443.1 SpoIIE family protein phosphatase [Spirochaetota bacterium]HQF07758.1 SpoIIE family protein phosphatase [Spirochaetota bacterium]HQH96811.1 SpoIIE family protein phosphatase [Spirochaetota bacterium]
MKFFQFLAKNINYTFALSAITVATSWVLSLFAFFLGTSFIMISFDKLSLFYMKWLPVAVAIPTLVHWILFGLLAPLKIPPLMEPLRAVNEAYKKNLEIPEEDFKKVYTNFSDLPMYNLLHCTLLTAVAGIIILGLAFYEYRILGAYTAPEFSAMIKATSLTVIIIIILYGMSTYLFTESLTNPERSAMYNKIVSTGASVKPRALIGIRLKFLFFVWLMVITLLTFAALMEKVRFFEEFNIAIIFLYFGISVLASFLLMQITTRSIMRILNDLIRVTRTIASGGTAGYKVLSLEREFTAIEFALMETAREIDDFRRDVEGKVARRTEELEEALSSLRSRDEQIQKQLDMASVIQRSILPGKIDDWNELKFAVRYIAMEKIGGDFYDVHLLKDDKIGVMIADVSGHGIPAALVTTMAKMSFGNAGSKYDSPKKIFQEMNQNILDHVKTQDYMTCFMLAVDDDYNMVYSNASHQKAILLRHEGDIELLDTNGLFIGAIEEARESYDEKKTKLEYGDRVVLYTDGIPEAINEERVEYSNRRLEEAIRRYRSLPAEEFAEAIINDVRQFMGNAQLVDDITLLVVELSRDEAVDIIKNSKRLINAHQYQEATEVLEKGFKKYPENQKILYNLAKNYFRVNSFRKAIDRIQAYIENDKMNKNAYYIGGASYYQLGDFDNAILFFEKGLEIDPGFVNALFAMGMAYKKKGDEESAMRSFEKVINIDPDNKMAMFEIRSMTEKK